MSSDLCHPLRPRVSAPSFLGGRKLRAGFTLAEMMVTVGVMALCGGVIIGAISTMATVSAKNVALNDSGINMRRAILRLTTSVEESVEVTDVSNFNPATNTFTTVASGTWGNAVRLMALLPGSCYIVDSATSAYSAASPPLNSSASTTTYLPAGTTTVYATYATNSSAMASLIPTLTGSERLLALYPVRRQPEPAPGKLGLALSGKPVASAGKITFNLASPLTVAAASISSDTNATIMEYNPAYLLRECAYVVLPSGDGKSCSLYSMADTAVPGTRVLRSPAIAGTQPGDIYHPAALSAGTGACFCLSVNSAGQQVLQILLPVSAKDYSNALLNNGSSQAAYNMYITANIHRRSLQGINTQ